jgi:hypothetical protein
MVTESGLLYWLQSVVMARPFHLALSTVERSIIFKTHGFLNLIRKSTLASSPPLLLDGLIIILDIITLSRLFKAVTAWAI